MRLVSSNEHIVKLRLQAQYYIAGIVAEVARVKNVAIDVDLCLMIGGSAAAGLSPSDLMEVVEAPLPLAPEIEQAIVRDVSGRLDVTAARRVLLAVMRREAMPSIPDEELEIKAGNVVEKVKAWESSAGKLLVWPDLSEGAPFAAGQQGRKRARGASAARAAFEVITGGRA